MFGVELVPMELASMPLIRTLLLVVRWPLTEMTESPRPSSVLFETLADVPGESVRSCWKLRVGSGSWRDLPLFDDAPDLRALLLDQRPLSRDRHGLRPARLPFRA